MSIFWRITALLLLLAGGLAHAQGGFNLAASLQPDRAATAHVQAQLVALAPQGVAAGAPLQLGLLLRHQPQWHTYWKNAGDSGLPTALRWSLPAGWEAGDIAWPTPQQIRVGDLLNYGYEGQVLLPVPITVGADFVPPADGQMEIGLQASWLVCRVECIPEDVELQLTLPVTPASTLWATQFALARQAQPLPLEAGQARVDVLPDGEHVTLHVDGLPPHVQGQNLAFYPEAANTFHHAAELGKDWSQQWQGPQWQATLPLSTLRGDTPSALDVVLGLPVEGSTVAEQPPAQSWRVHAPVYGQWQAAQQLEISPALAAALAANASNISNISNTATPPSSGNSGWLAALVGGVLGGLLLNLMPCVFPVLAIKLLGFARHGSDVQAQRVGGLAYTAGTVLSFVALGAPTTVQNIVTGAALLAIVAFTARPQKGAIAK